MKRAFPNTGIKYISILHYCLLLYICSILFSTAFQNNLTKMNEEMNWISFTSGHWQLASGASGWLDEWTNLLGGKMQHRCFMKNMKEQMQKSVIISYSNCLLTSPCILFFIDEPLARQLSCYLNSPPRPHGPLQKPKKMWRSFASKKFAVLGVATRLVESINWSIFQTVWQHGSQTFVNSFAVSVWLALLFFRDLEWKLLH